MLAIANALDGMNRAVAAAAAGLERQALRDAVTRYNAEGLTGLVDRPGPGEIGIRLGRLHDGPLDSGEVVDAAGGWLLPGFVDAHLHMGLGGEGIGS